MTFEKSNLLTKWYLLCARFLTRRTRAEILRSGTTLCSFAWVAILIPGGAVAFIGFVAVPFFLSSNSIIHLALFFGLMLCIALGAALLLGTMFGVFYLCERSYEKHGVFFVLSEYGKAVKGKVCPLVKFK